MNVKKKKGTDTLEIMRPIVAGSLTYQRNKSSYCQEHDLNPYTFDYWRNRIRDLDGKNKRSKSSKFIAVKPLASTTIPISEPNPAFIKLHLPDGKRLELPTTVSDKLLISLLQIRIK